MVTIGKVGCSGGSDCARRRGRGRVLARKADRSSEGEWWGRVRKGGAGSEGKGGKELEITLVEAVC